MIVKKKKKEHKNKIKNKRKNKVISVQKHHKASEEIFDPFEFRLVGKSTMPDMMMDL
ncbi:MAG TPA: hypothetical protein VD815_04585 [Candidatus Saccharimonadales bacterium]|nr:hypothetical protein [Candidatus Saccharimonadales bacterium]